jgi:hypothetical protein
MAGRSIAAIVAANIRHARVVGSSFDSIEMKVDIAAVACRACAALLAVCRKSRRGAGEETEKGEEPIRDVCVCVFSAKESKGSKR